MTRNVTNRKRFGQCRMMVIMMGSVRDAGVTVSKTNIFNRAIVDAVWFGKFLFLVDETQTCSSV